MSFIYSQALEAAFSGGSCSDTEQSAPLSGNPTHKLCLSHDRTMDASRLSRFGMTCKPLTESRGAELLTWWLAGFRAKTFPLQEKAQELTEPGQECGDTWLGWLAKFDPASSSWKTAQLSLIGDSGESLATFPRSGMTRGGLLWELPMLERPTNATGSGFWPTPVASDTSSRNVKYAQGGTPLSLAVKLWPTPTVCGNYNRKGASKTSGDGLATAVKTWPTPQASDNRNRGTSQTPAIARRIEAGKQVMLSMVMDGPLNPDWTEWLMGWPIGHTDLQPSATVKSRPAPQWLGELLEGLEA